MKDCPNCDNQGWYIISSPYAHSPEQEQCEFCYTVEDSIFNVVGQLKQNNDKLVKALEAALFCTEALLELDAPQSQVEAWGNLDRLKPYALLKQVREVKDD